MFKQIDTKYAMIILAVIIILCIIIGLVVLNMAADKHMIEYITQEYKKLYIRNYELEQENENLRKINIKLREENVSIGKQLDKFLGEWLLWIY